ncbi:MAG: type III-B CRISPR-associated protein Cas10/Cmr2 [Magnetococcales bacterium]|nr:type III-B CRISPR-associated protein Cas10/Cmr2 [Magnetococcales bacterium]
MTEQILHFTLGPVQNFVAQARRTRDLWAGSFLLSWLSGKAMRALVDKGWGEIDFPDVQGDAMFRALGGEGIDPAPVVGSLPNRFKATITQAKVQAGELCREAINQAWHGLADAVWETFVAPVAPRGRETRAIWERQIDGFWETSWVMGQASDGSDGGWLDRRKNWRTHPRREEGGDRCTIMSDWQEISGWVRFRERERQEVFWDSIRQGVLDEVYAALKGNKEVNTLELRDNERLCAIALVKRLFPLLPDETLKSTVGWIPDGTRKVLRKWPSTAYMAAAPWMKRASERNEQACQDYVKAIKACGDDAILTQRAEHISRIANFHPMGAFADLDGHLFFSDAVCNDKVVPPRSQKEVLKALQRFQGDLLEESTKRRLKMKEASPYYALLLMDGDRIGDLLQKWGGKKVSKALGEFAGKIPKIVEKHDGVTIYAGGDDYLGLFPLPSALPAAALLADAYQASWKEGGGGTISAGVAFAHHGVALSAVLRKVHHLLDAVAKEKNGRDGIAVAVMKSGGDAFEWGSCWRKEEKDAASGVIHHLVTLAKAFADDDDRSTSFVYHLRDRYDSSLWEGLDERQTHAILFAERLKGTEMAREIVEKEIDELLRVCRPLTKESGSVERGAFTSDGALLARFLADNGIWLWNGS